MMSESTPICRCRVLYLGSAVPRQSKDGLQGIQEPLRSLYPVEGAGEAKGIDSWLSVWSNGILLENVDENRKQVTRFFPIDSLHYCAAVRQVLIPERGNAHPEPKFLPLDSPFARTPRVQHPPIFAAILRRTTGIKVLECHSFICKREAAANALVRCCFHAYADNSYAKQIETGSSAPGSVYGTLGGKSSLMNGDTNGWTRAGSTTTLNSTGRHHQTNGHGNGIDDAYTVKNSKCKKVFNLLNYWEYREVWNNFIVELVTTGLYWKLVASYCELSLKRKQNLWLTMNRDLCGWDQIVRKGWASRWKVQKTRFWLRHSRIVFVRKNVCLRVVFAWLPFNGVVCFSVETPREIMSESQTHQELLKCHEKFQQNCNFMKANHVRNSRRRLDYKI